MMSYHFYIFPFVSTPKRNTQNASEKYKNGMTSSPILRNKREKRKSNAFQTMNKKFSKSIHDLLSFARSPTHEEDENKNESKSCIDFENFLFIV